MKGPRWTRAEEQWLLAHLGRDGWGFEACARHLGRSTNGVRVHLVKEMRIKRPLSRNTDGALRLGDLVEVMGLAGDHHAARRWITAGLLKAERMPEQWRGKPNPFRTAAPKVAPPTAGFLTVKQAARCAGIAPDLMRDACRLGRIPARHIEALGVHPQEWFIRPADLEAYLRRRSTPPACTRIRAEVERRQLDVRRAVPERVQDAIAAQCGCRRCSVQAVLTAMRKELGIRVPVGSWRPKRPERPAGPWQVRYVIHIACYVVTHRLTGERAFRAAKVDAGALRARDECDRLNARGVQTLRQEAA